MRLHSMRITVGVLVAILCVPTRDAHALYVSGNASTQAGGGTAQYVYLPGPESTTGLVITEGTCSTARAQATLSASAGTHVALSYAGGSPAPPNCGSTAYAYDNVGDQDDFVIQSATLPPGTLVDVSLCIHAATRHAAAFACGGNVNEQAASQATTTVQITCAGKSQSAQGSYSEQFDCFDPHGESETGLYAPGGGGQTLTLTGVPVGAIFTVNVSTSIASSATSVQYPAEAWVEVASVLGYSSTSDVKLVSTATATELNPASLCSDSIAVALLPPAGVLAVGASPQTDRVELLPPAPNPTAGPVTFTFALPRAQRAELAIFDLAGARVAKLADGARTAGLHRVVWDGRDERGGVVRAGLYWARLITPSGSLSRVIARIR